MFMGAFQHEGRTISDTFTGGIGRPAKTKFWSYFALKFAFGLSNSNSDLFRLRVNFGEMDKVEAQNFVLAGCPKAVLVLINLQAHLRCTSTQAIN